MKVVFALSALLLAVTPTADAAVTVFASLLAPEAVGATGSGSVLLEYDDLAHTLSIDADFMGLSGVTTVAHIHCCTAVPGAGTVGVAVTPVTLPGFPVGVSSGTYTTLIDLTNVASYTGGFLSGGVAADGEAALIAGLDAGTAYLNIHSSTFGGGEIRGFPAQVPEPGTCALSLAVLLAVAGARWRS